MFELPDSLELFEFFEMDPVDSNENEGFISYSIRDGNGGNGLALNFSCHAIEGSVQADVVCSGHDVVTISGEQVVCVKIKRDQSGHQYLFIEFEIQGMKSEAKVWVKPHIRVQWFSMSA